MGIVSCSLDEFCWEVIWARSFAIFSFKIAFLVSSTVIGLFNGLGGPRKGGRHHRGIKELLLKESCNGVCLLLRLEDHVLIFVHHTHGVFLSHSQHFGSSKHLSIIFECFDFSSDFVNLLNGFPLCRFVDEAHNNISILLQGLSFVGVSLLKNCKPQILLLNGEFLNVLVEKGSVYWFPPNGVVSGLNQDVCKVIKPGQ